MGKMTKEEVVSFLKDLQTELRSQPTDCQASPRFWTIGDYEIVDCSEGCHDLYEIILPRGGEFDNYKIEDFVKEVLSESSEMTDEDSKEKLKEIVGDDDSYDYDDVLDWAKENVDKEAYLLPCRRQHIVKPNTMFITKEEARNHLKANHYHYTKEAHTYAMTAWRAPRVEKLWKILEEADWDEIFVPADKISEAVDKIKTTPKKDPKTLRDTIEQKITMTINLSEDDVKNVILEKLEREGQDPKKVDIKFMTSYKYVSDEWGMNERLVTKFIGAVVEIKESAGL